MDANINHGSSGGPVCNERGEVVGLTTFGSLENNGGLAAGLNFAVPVTILDEYLDSAGITATPGTATRRFARALECYSNHQYRTALKQFETVLQFNSHYPGIYTYIADCRENIKDGNDRAAGSVVHVLTIATLLLLLAGALAIWAIRRAGHQGASQ
jgi:hypothetical protein